MVCLLALLVGGVVYCIVPRTYIASGIQCSGDYTARGIEWFMTSLFLGCTLLVAYTAVEWLMNYTARGIEWFITSLFLGGTLLAAYIAVVWLMSSLSLGNKLLAAYSAVVRLRMVTTWYEL